MNIAIIGGSGFIGTVLARYIVNNFPSYTFKILDITPSLEYPDYFVHCDVTDADEVVASLKGFDVIYNLAAEHRDDVNPIKKYYDVNVGGADNIVKAAKFHGISRIIFTSTVAVYGLDKHESKETDAPDPFNDYGHSKHKAEHVFNEWAQSSHDNQLITIRLVATFGVGNRGNIYNLIRQIAHNRFVMIGDGKNQKSIAYVDNVAAFLAQCLTMKHRQEVYNYADKPDVTMNDFVHQVRALCDKKPLQARLPKYLGLTLGRGCDVMAKLINRPLPVSTIRIQKFMANTVVNADKAHAVFKPPHTIYDGLNTMIKNDFKI